LLALNDCEVATAYATQLQRIIEIALKGLDEVSVGLEVPKDTLSQTLALNLQDFEV